MVLLGGKLLSRDSGPQLWASSREKGHGSGPGTLAPWKAEALLVHFLFVFLWRRGCRTVARSF